MAHFRRKRSRIKGGRGKSRGNWMCHWPAWWDRLFHIRPLRRKNHKLEKDLQLNKIDPDEATPPLGNHKPHKYYW